MENRCLLRPLVTLLFEKFSAGATLCTYMWRTLLPRVTSLKTRMTQLIPKNRFSTTSFIMAFWVFIVILFRYLNIRNNLFFLFENKGAQSNSSARSSSLFIEFEFNRVSYCPVWTCVKLEFCSSISSFGLSEKSLLGFSSSILAEFQFSQFYQNRYKPQLSWPKKLCLPTLSIRIGKSKITT